MVDKMTYDIHFQPVPANEVLGYRMFTFGFESALKVDGPQALVNRWVKTFVTPKGTDPTNLNYGTAFGQLIGANFTDLSDLKDAVFLALTDANEQVKQQDIDGLYPQNERLRDALLVDVKASESAAGIEVWVKLVNLAGQAAPIILSTGPER